MITHMYASLARDSIYAERAIRYRLSICPSARLSVCHTGGSVNKTA